MGAVYRRRAVMEFDLVNCLLRADAHAKRLALIMKVFLNHLKPMAGGLQHGNLKVSELLLEFKSF
jgi:hypothetical protein